MWEDLPSLFEALKAHQISQTESTQEQPKPAAKADDVDPLIQAIVAIEGARIDISIQTQIAEQLDLCTHVSLCVLWLSYRYIH